jgi:hypothetical protein
MTKPKIMFLNVDYAAFTDRTYRDNPGLAHLPYVQQKARVLEEGFGDADHWARGMIAAGWDAEVVITNNHHLIGQWSLDNSYEWDVPETWVCERIRRYKPDVLFSMGLWIVNDRVHKIARGCGVKVIAGHCGSQLDNFEADRYDVIFTPTPQYVDKFAEAGVYCEYLPMAFAPRLYDPKDRAKWNGVSFIGGITANHQRRYNLIKKVGEVLAPTGRLLHCYGYGFDELKDAPGIAYQGEAWGRDAYGILGFTEITINAHIDFVHPYVGNMRMFEATGCGALLITDWGENIEKLFVPGKEVIAYKSITGAAAAVLYYLDHREEARIIAENGRQRTLRDHTYEKRTAEVARILEKML